MENKENTKTVLVLGASMKPTRYSNKAVLALKERGHEVYAIGRSDGQINGITIEDSLADLDNGIEVHTISMYLREVHQSEYEKDIIAMKPKRVIFNPGAENAEFYDKLNKEGIEAMNACTLVLLSIGNF